MTPKAKLQAAPSFKEVSALLQSPLLEHCLEVALLTFVENQSEGADGIQSHADHQRLLGARRFISTLKNLAIPPTEAKPNRIGQLNPQ